MAEPENIASAEEITQHVKDTSVKEIKKDGWTNFLVGLGGKKDKSIRTTIGDFTVLDDYTLGDLYMSNGLSGRIIDIVADDMTREWITLDGGSAKTIETELTRLDAEEKFNEAFKWQRLYGGSLLIIGAMDGQKPDKPLKTNKIRNIEYLKVVDRTCIPIGECVFDKNPASPDFGKILTYKINYRVNDTIVPMIIHASRCIPFFNDTAPPSVKMSSTLDLQYWGMSSLQRIYEDIRDLGGITQSTVNIMYEFIIGKYKIEHLNEMLAQGEEGKLVTRMEIMEMCKSVLNGVLLSTEEEYTRDYATLAGIPEVIDRFMLMLSGSTSIPVTRLFGRSPSGLNATGENDLRNYYDLIEANQRNRFMPPLRKLVDVLCTWKNVDIPVITFNSLYQLDEKEKADIGKIKAETEQIYSNIEAREVELEIRNQEEIRIKRGYQTPIEEPDESGN